MNEGAHYWRSLDGTIGVRLLEESRGHCGRSTVGNLEDTMEGRLLGDLEDTMVGRLLGESWVGRPLTNSTAGGVLGRSASYKLWLGLFYTQHQSSYFRVWVMNEGSTEKFS